MTERHTKSVRAERWGTYQQLRLIRVGVATDEYRRRSYGWVSNVPTVYVLLLGVRECEGPVGVMSKLTSIILIFSSVSLRPERIEMNPEPRWLDDALVSPGPLESVGE